MEDANIRAAEEQVMHYNAGLAVIQLCCGMISGSSIMLADSLYSAFLAFGGVQEGMYRKRDMVLSVILTVMFLAAAVLLVVMNIRRMLSGRYLGMERPGAAVILIGAGSMLMKKMLSRHLIYEALEYRSSLLVAVAWHQRQDFIWFGISVAGLCLTKAGLMWAEPVTGILMTLAFFRKVLVL